jgi:hypothetical protein
MQRGDNSLFPIRRPTDRCAHAHDLLIPGNLRNHVIDVCQIFFRSDASEDVVATLTTFDAAIPTNSELAWRSEAHRKL